MTNSGNLALIEEFFFVMSTNDDEETQIIDIAVSIDLAEFEFTELELQKLRRLCRRLELALLTEFTQRWAAASVIVEIRP
jgi:hypothetical protein